MQTETVKLADLKHPEVNPRKHPAKQLNEFMRSIEKYGQYRPFVIDENNVVYVGNGMLDAMVQLGMTEGIAYRLSGMTAEEKNKLMLSDNKVYDLGIDSMDAVDTLMESFADFDIPGFDEEILKGIYLDMEDFVEDEILTYGEIPQEVVERKQAQHEINSRRIESASNAQEQPQPTVTVDTTVSKSLTCPHCGKEIVF